MDSAQIPNNLGPTLMIVAAVVLLPLGVGIPLLLIALARLRRGGGSPAFPRLQLVCKAVVQPWLPMQRPAVLPPVGGGSR